MNLLQVLTKPVTSMDDIMPRGGRGKRAPYATTVVRVPEPCLDAVWAVLDHYRETGEVFAIDDNKLKFSEAVEQARLIYQSKIGRTKSAKQSMEKLLQLVYSRNVEL